MNLEPRVGVEPTTCRLLHLRYLAVSSSFSLRLPFPFSTVFGRNCSQVVPKFVADITSFLKPPLQCSTLRQIGRPMHGIEVGKKWLRGDEDMPLTAFVS